MKRLFTFFICLLPFTFAHAGTTLTTPDSNRYTILSSGRITSFAQHTDTILAKQIQPGPDELKEFNIFESRLDSIQKDVQLDYNGYVQSYIDTYSSRKSGIATILGKAQYYFPIYEKAFRDVGIPEEIKYLSIVESELNPFAVSRAGATGPWQFMYATGRLYGLNIDSYVDERRDPIQASYAAAAYLRDAYQEFGDWLLAIASYNCGKGAVARAIDKAGANDFWSIRAYLPSETRNYVPAYIAMTYVMNYFNCHDITPQACAFSLKTDTVLVNKFVPFIDIAKALDINSNDVALLNPAYKRGVVNGSEKEPRRIVIPQTSQKNYVALYETLYGPGYKVPERHMQLVSNTEKADEIRPQNHKIRQGETLSDIANRYRVTVQDLKVWNNLSNTKAVIGRVLRLTAPDAVKPAPKPQPVKSFITYKVQPGDTLSEIAAKFKGASVEKIKQINGLSKKAIQPGMLLKIVGV